jgi:hypothetical protein
MDFHKIILGKLHLYWIKEIGFLIHLNSKYTRKKNSFDNTCYFQLNISTYIYIYKLTLIKGVLCSNVQYKIADIPRNTLNKRYWTDAHQTK